MLIPEKLDLPENNKKKKKITTAHFISIPLDSPLLVLLFIFDFSSPSRLRCLMSSYLAVLLAIAVCLRLS